MYQRHICPSMGAIWRPLSRAAPAISNGSPRAFHRPARLQAEPNDANNANANTSTRTAAAGSQPLRDTRRTRAAAAGQRVINLSKRTSGSGGLARNVFPSGQGVNIPGGRTIPEALGSEGPGEFSPSPTAGRARPLIRREVIGPASTGGGRQPPGTLVRAPSNLRLSRAPAPGMTKGSGPNLRNRDRPASQGSGERAPKRRERKSKTTSSAARAGGQRSEDVKIEDTLSDAMVQHLLRLQRKEWDKVAYEPMYVQRQEGELSPAALELIEAGKRLFEGEPPKAPRKPGRLEKRLHISNMHGV